MRNLYKNEMVNFIISHKSQIVSGQELVGLYKDVAIKNGFEIIGTAHNQIEFYIKKNQGCNIIFLSPIFKTQKYSDNKILGINRFKLMSKYWKIPILAWGGIKEKNYNNLGNLKIYGVGTASYFK